MASAEVNCGANEAQVRVGALSTALIAHYGEVGGMVKDLKVAFAEVLAGEPDQPKRAVDIPNYLVWVNSLKALAEKYFGEE
jgi:hypothetical protein